MKISKQFSSSQSKKKDKHYDAVDILPSSSSFDKNYPEFYGDHTLSQQFLWNVLLEGVKSVS